MIRPGRLNKAHEHTHEQTVSGTTLKGIGGRRDEMSVWGLEGRTHTEACYWEQPGGMPFFTIDFWKEDQLNLIDPSLDGIPIPTLPNEVVVATHCSVAHIAGAPNFDSFFLVLFDANGVIMGVSPVIALAAVVTITCFKWSTTPDFTSCDAWYVVGLSSLNTAEDVKIRLLNQFIARAVP